MLDGAASPGEFGIGPTGSVVYIADQDTNDVLELYAIPGVLFADSFEAMAPWFAFSETMIGSSFSDRNVLSREQIEQFREQGFVVLERLFSVADMAVLRSAAERIVDEFDIEHHRTVFATTDRDKGRDQYFMDSAENVSCFLEADALGPDGELTKPKNAAINKIGHAMHDLIPEFTAFCRRSEFGEMLREIGYSKPRLWQTMYIFKQPRIGGVVRWHQDASYLKVDPPAVTGLWVAIEDAHRGNGCLWVQPGGHKSPLREIFEVDPGHSEGQLRTLDETPWPTEESAFPVEVPAGSLLVFADTLPHYSSHNHSDQSRHAFSMHVAEDTARWSNKNWLQRPGLLPFYVS